MIFAFIRFLFWGVFASSMCTVVTVLVSCGGGGSDSGSLDGAGIGGTGTGDGINSLEAVIKVEPSSTVNVYEELFFDASTTIDDKELFQGGKYEWDFGDGYKFANPEGGITATHTYTRPGTYTVILSVTDIDGNSNSAQQVITVNGDYTQLAPRADITPLMQLKFDEDINDSSGNNLNAVWQDGEGVFVNGIEGMALDLTGGKSVRVDNTSILGGLEQITISLWFKKSDSSNTGYLLRKFDTSTSHSAFDMRIQSHYFGGYIETDNAYGHCASYAESQYTVDDSWHHYAYVYDGAMVRLYIDGVEIVEGGSSPRSPLVHSGILNNSNDPLYIGSNRGNDVFSGYIDEIKIYDKALTPQELFIGFEMWHADFHGHKSQYLYVKIPGELRKSDTARIAATITGDNNYSQQLSLNQPNEVLTLIDVEKTDLTDLKSEEKILLNNSLLPGASGKYTLSVRITNAAGEIIDTINESFYKTYDGEPKVGIDENNAIRVDGELFFPIGPTGLNNADITNSSDDYYRDWEGNGYINVLRSQGFWPTDVSVAAWESYLNVSENLMAIGPARWEGLVNHRDMRPYWRNAYIDNLVEYVEAVKDHPATFLWNWASEPDLGDDMTYVPAPVVRSWTYKTHQLDPQHLVTVTFAGHYWTEGVIDYHKRRRRKYEYPYNANQFGQGTQIYKGTHVGDVYEIDYYPLEWASPHTRGATNALLASALDNFYLETNNLVPLLSLVETTDINEGDGGAVPPTTWHPTPEQLKMMIWVNVVHGVKGLGWFHYHTRTPEANFGVMAEFVEQIEELTPIILGPDIENEITVETTSGPQGEGRIDAMIKEYQGKYYFFTVRLSETESEPNPEYIEDKPLGEGGQEFGYPDPIQNYPVTATINIAGLSGASIELYNENGRAISMSNGQFQDSFLPYEVHIYEITPVGE